MDMARDMREIGRIMASAEMLMAVRREVCKVMREGFLVTDGRHLDGGAGYDVVVRCAGGKESEVARRIRSSMPDVDVDGLSDGMLGVRTARRGRVPDGI
jgi:hypothetical protein